ncbi:MAG: (Fe-S)-binding protein [Gammaproteobacteria bacterium]|nr:(Fe-S)-binding protein [Gammaproteobacteria bacterium]
MTEAGSQQTVALFATCLVDLYRPEVGFATVRLIERAGYAVTVPEQGCCGQPNFNSGDQAGARLMALAIMKRFSDHDYVVTPSGSCAAMIRCHYPELFEPGSEERTAAEALAAKTWELTSFLHDVACVEDLDSRVAGTVTYHDACSGLRELGVQQQPRALLALLPGIELREMPDAEACCGFGGLFCIKYPDVSSRIATSKLESIVASGADYVVTGDVGCLMQMAGKLHREGSPVKVRHIAELLAGEVQKVSDADDQ